MKFKTNSKPIFTDVKIVSIEEVSREEVIKEFGEEWVNEVERNMLLGVNTHLVAVHGWKTWFRSILNYITKWRVKK